MSRIYFNTACDACGRRLRIDCENLGMGVRCPHCTACFVAQPRVGATGGDDPSRLMRRVDELLEASSQQ